MMPRRTCSSIRLPCSTYDRGLNQELEREGEGIVAHRGLIPTYQGSREKCENQVFQIYITEDVRRQYDAMMTQRLMQVRSILASTLSLPQNAFIGKVRDGLNQQRLVLMPQAWSGFRVRHSAACTLVYPCVVRPCVGAHCA